MWDFSFSEAQQILRNGVRDFIKKHQPLEEYRRLESQKEDYSRLAHEKMVDLGWFGFRVPSKYGGEDLSWLDGVVMYEEFGRGLLRTYHWATAILAVECLRTFGTEDAKTQLLPQIARGEAAPIVAWQETGMGDDSGPMGTVALPCADGYELSGVKVPIYGARAATSFIVAAKKAGGFGDEVLLFNVSVTARGVAVTPLDALDSESLGHIALLGVSVSKGDLIGRVERAADFGSVLERASLLLAAEMVGGAGRALELATEYAKARVAFGRPIGSFQAIQHKLANILIEIEGAKVALYYASWLTDEGKEGTAERAIALAQAQRASRIAVAEATQTFGGIGLVIDTDVALFYRRAKTLQLMCGSPWVLREKMVEKLLA